MSKIVSLIKNPVFLSFIGILFICLFIWFVGPMIGINDVVLLESIRIRLIAITVVIVLWILSILVGFIISKRRNAAMLESLADNESPEDVASAEELKILQSKMQDAIATLKKSNFTQSGGRRFIYELPWYVIIGPPGAGKTTLLSNSGLNFPLEETHGKLSVKGLGGTRNCDWWFTDQAVLLDTAGRYTTQDSEAAVDKSAWKGFLGMLKEKRSRRPINGVLLAISIEDLLTGDDSTIENSAKVLRTRIDELYNDLGIAPPIYLIITKCDLLTGFSDFFADLDRRDREQVWGHTFALDNNDNESNISDVLNKLSQKVHQQTIGKMHAELSQKKRENIYGFPLQYNFAQQRVARFIEHLTKQSRLLQPILFRGVYFSSATQTGTSLDQVIQTVSSSFGLSEQHNQHPPGEGRSYFIHRLLDGVVFQESGLAGTNLATERKLKRLQWGLTAAMIILALGLSLVWSLSYWNNLKLIRETEAASDRLQQSIATLDTRSIDLLAVNKALNDAKALVSIHHDDHDVLTASTGLYQGNQIHQFAQKKYHQLLINALLPRLMVRLEHQMHARNDDSEFLFEALKTYQMIGLRERFISSDVVGWFSFDIDNQVSNDIAQINKDQLKGHIAELFKERPQPLPRPLDQAMIRQYQEIAANIPLHQRAYNRLKNRSINEINTFLRLTEAVGPELSSAMIRQDDQSLDQSIQRFYTLSGYQNVFLPESQNINQALASDNWVLGPFAEISVAETTIEELTEQVKSAYFTDYIQQWESLFSSISLRSVEGLENASRLVALLTDIDSPLKKLLVFAARQTTLTQPPSQNGTDGASPSGDRASELSSLLTQPAEDTPVPVVVDPVTEHFATLHALIQGFETNTSTLDGVLTQLAELNIQLLPMSQSPAGTIDPALSAELAITMQKLTLKSDRLAAPLSGLVSDLTNDISDVVGGGFCQQVESAWQTDVLPFYRQAIQSRYPVSRNSSADIALSDFGTFFGHGGILDTFVATHLKDQVSKTPRQWTWIGTGASVCLSDNSLRQLALAEDIKNTFFVPGATLPAFRFDLIPTSVAMSADINHLFFDVGGTRAEYFHGPIRGATSFTWPTPDNNNQVSLRVEPVVPGTASSFRLSGPWSILRLFDQGQRNPTAGGLNINYSFGGRSVSLALATSSFNPLNSVSLRNFRAPESL